MGLILDTSFVVAFERETRCRISGRADRFLASQPETNPAISFITAGEVACGQSAAEQVDWRRLIAPYRILPWSMEIAWQYGELFRHLQAQGKLIGSNDLWIAATALVHGMELVTDNMGEFSRVPGLRIRGF